MDKSKFTIHSLSLQRCRTKVAFSLGVVIVYFGKAIKSNFLLYFAFIKGKGEQE